MDCVGCELGVLLASFPGLPREGRRKAWYTLRAHARNFVLKLRNTQVQWECTEKRHQQALAGRAWLNIGLISCSFMTRTD